MTLLDEIIDAATDSSVATPDLLRKVQVVAHRLHAQDAIAWVRQELNGYDDAAVLPTYRKMRTPVMGTFAGPMRSFTKHQLTLAPAGMGEMFSVELREPVLELQAFAEQAGEHDPGREWPASAVQQYENSGIFRIEFFSLYKAHNVITRQSLRGLIDVIRTKALEFALALQESNPDAGSLGGPTVGGSPELQAAVFHITHNIYGDGTNIATGAHINQSTTLAPGDADALRAAVAEVLSDQADVNAFAEALVDEGRIDGDRVSDFLKRLRGGAVNVAGSIGVDVAASMLVGIAKQYLGM
ncbi:hypothetical protein [Demequina sp.]|uniref:AbiTii domain-containing protein n=1 Tax=Demequina sp. TaxID=2050685 RepID=UPI003A87C861